MISSIGIVIALFAGRDKGPWRPAMVRFIAIGIGCGLGALVAVATVAVMYYVVWKNVD
jgi:hypothetical protein